MAQYQFLNDDDVFRGAISIARALQETVPHSVSDPHLFFQFNHDIKLLEEMPADLTGIVW